MYKGLHSLTTWLLELVNPPVREQMTARQKITRTFVISGTLVIGCVMVALIGASVLVVLQQIQRVAADSDTLAKAVAIVLTSICGNIICVIAIMEIRRIDRENLPKAGPP